MFMHRLVLTVLTVCLAGVTLAACDSGKPAAEGTGGTKVPESLCGVALSDTARRSLQDLVGVEDYMTLGPDQGAQDTAKDLVVDFETGQTSSDHELCRAFVPSAEARATSVAFSLESKTPTDPASSFTQYELGVTALAKASNAVLYLKCSSSQFQESGAGEVLIRGELLNMRTSLSDTEKTREENLTVLHAASRALIEQLGCEKDAGLPAQFSAPQKA